MKTIRLGMTFLIVVLLAFLFANGVYAQEKKTIRIGSPFKSGHIVVDAAEKFKELVEKGSGGRIEVKIDAGTKSEEAISKLNRTGEIEMQSNGTMVPAGLRPPVLLLHWSLRHEGLRSLHARLERSARPGGAGPVRKERPEVPGDHLPGAAADDGQEAGLHAGGRVRPEAAPTQHPHLDGRLEGDGYGPRWCPAARALQFA